MRLGAQEENKVHEAELAGILLSLKLVEQEEKLPNVVLFVDNQGAISLVKKLCNGGGRGTYWEMMILEELERVLKRHGDVQVVFRWIPGHGNTLTMMERVDEEAKAATAQGPVPTEVLAQAREAVCSF
jgi:ribonuclease HI